MAATSGDRYSISVSPGTMSVVMSKSTHTEAAEAIHSDLEYKIKTATKEIFASFSEVKSKKLSKVFKKNLILELSRKTNEIVIQHLGVCIKENKPSRLNIKISLNDLNINLPSPKKFDKALSKSIQGDIVLSYKEASREIDRLQDELLALIEVGDIYKDPTKKEKIDEKISKIETLCLELNNKIVLLKSIGSTDEKEIKTIEASLKLKSLSKEMPPETIKMELETKHVTQRSIDLLQTIPDGHPDFGRAQAKIGLISLMMGIDKHKLTSSLIEGKDYINEGIVIAADNDSKLKEALVTANLHIGDKLGTNSVTEHLSSDYYLHVLALASEINDQIAALSKIASDLEGNTIFRPLSVAQKNMIIDKEINDHIAATNIMTHPEIETLSKGEKAQIQSYISGKHAELPESIQAHPEICQQIETVKTNCENVRRDTEVRISIEEKRGYAAAERARSELIPQHVKIVNLPIPQHTLPALLPIQSAFKIAAFSGAENPEQSIKWLNKGMEMLTTVIPKILEKDKTAKDKIQSVLEGPGGVASILKGMLKNPNIHESVKNEVRELQTRMSVEFEKYGID